MCGKGERVGVMNSIFCCIFFRRILSQNVVLILMWDEKDNGIRMEGGVVFVIG